MTSPENIAPTGIGKNTNCTATISTAGAISRATLRPLSTPPPVLMLPGRTPGAPIGTLAGAARRARVAGPSAAGAAEAGVRGPVSARIGARRGSAPEQRSAPRARPRPRRESASMAGAAPPHRHRPRSAPTGAPAIERHRHPRIYHGRAPGEIGSGRPPHRDHPLQHLTARRTVAEPPRSTSTVGDSVTQHRPSSLHSNNRATAAGLPRRFAPGRNAPPKPVGGHSTAVTHAATRFASSQTPGRVRRRRAPPRAGPPRERPSRAPAPRPQPVCRFAPPGRRPDERPGTGLWIGLFYPEALFSPVLDHERVPPPPSTRTAPSTPPRSVARRRGTERPSSSIERSPPIVEARRFRGEIQPGPQSSQRSSPEAYCWPRHAERCSLPEDVFGTVPGSTSTTSFGGIPTESATSRVTPPPDARDRRRAPRPRR